MINNDIINHANILYVRNISIIGGVETFIYEMVKKYKDLDIAVVCKYCDPEQEKRLRQYCRVYKHKHQEIHCKVAIINYDISIIDYIKEGEIYQVIHGDYENPAYKWKPPTDPRIKDYIAITKYIQESFKRITRNENVILGYNPLTIEEKPRKLILISATRLSSVKGVDRMIKLTNALDTAGIDYVWFIFTSDSDRINNPNVIFMKPRLDIGQWIDIADYLVQLSDTEGCSYSINEALYRNTPVIVTPLPYLEEIGVKDGENSYIMDFDCSNINHIVENIRNIPKFEFKRLEDNYKKILAKSKSRYEEEKEMKVKVRALKKFEKIRDAERNVYPREGDEWITNLERAEYLRENGVIEIVEKTTEGKEEPIKETKKRHLKEKLL